MNLGVLFSGNRSPYPLRRDGPGSRHADVAALGEEFEA
jgi:hypothetical protein